MHMDYTDGAHVKKKVAKVGFDSQRKQKKKVTKKKGEKNKRVEYSLTNYQSPKKKKKKTYLLFC